MPDMYMMQRTGAGSYRGWDPGLNRDLEVQENEVVMVSGTKRRQLLADFPGDWVSYGETDPANAESSAPNVVDVRSPATDLQAAAEAAEEPKPRTRKPRRTKPHNPQQEQ